MNEKQFEECLLEEATHVEIGNTTYELDNGIVNRSKGEVNPSIRIVTKLGFNDYISEISFPMFGIKTLREKEKKREPIVFTHTVGGGIAPPNEAYGKTFLCVELVEEEK